MIDLSDKTKILVLIAIIGVVIFFFIQNRADNDEGTHNEGSLNQENGSTNITENEENEADEIEAPKETATNETDNIQDDESSKPRINLQKRILKGKVPEMQETDVATLRKFRTRNSSKDGSFINSSYADGKRGESRASELDKFFEGGHPLEEKVGFTQNDRNDDIQYANYVPGKQRKMRDVDKFNAEALLPKEKNKDWFDDPYESTSVKNTHLINIYRPIGINTISTTLKNPSHDIRGTVPNPKFVISPFLNSSYEPDTNLRNQSLCY